MKILLDTHYLLWAFIDTSKISQSVYHKLLADEKDKTNWKTAIADV